VVLASRGRVLDALDLGHVGILLITLGSLLSVSIAVAADLIIVRGPECTCVSCTVSLQLPVDSDFSIAVGRVKATCAGLLVYEADSNAISSATIRVKLGVLATAAFGPFGVAHRCILNG
jgi:hypothetical protein